MKPLLIIFLWIAVIWVKAYIDYYQIEKQKKNIRHGFELLLVAMVAFFHQWLSGVNKIEEWELAAWILLYQTMSWVLLFDMSLNLMRGKEIFYYGHTSMIDRFFHKIGGNGPYLMSKVFALVLMVTAIIQIWKA